MVKNLPHHALLCTDVGVGDGVVIGDMPLGNCVRQGKAERVATYMKEHGPFGESWGYGNFPDDVPMMNLMKYRVIV
jgi:phosphoserine phosphatase